MAISAMTLSGSLKPYRVILVVAISLLALLIFVLEPDADGSYGLPGTSFQDVGIRRTLQSTFIGRRVAPGDETINAKERLPYTYDFSGYMFDAQGSAGEVTKSVTTSLIHSFSPYVEREAAKRFIDPARDNIYYANSPAVMWFNGELILVTRIWLDREKYEPKNDWPANHFADNWLYTQKFDRNMRPINNGSIVGIPAPKQWWVGDGPIEPRLTKVRGRCFVTFNSAMAFSQKAYIDYTIMWDLERNQPIVPKILGGSPMVNATEGDEMPRDKHWMALVDNEQLHFVHNLDPLRVMKCSLTGYCKFIHNEKARDGFVFHDHVSHLRGGTPFELYQYPYYISIAHTTMYKKSNGHRFYTAHMVVICVKPWRIVYVSNDIKIHDQIYQTTPMVRPRWIDDGFIFPVGLILEGKDVMNIGVHVNDHSSVIIRMRGLQGSPTRHH